MTPSSISREEVIDVIYAALTNPHDSDNRFLHQLLVTAKDGYFSLNLLKGLVVKLADFPLTYLQHCIKHQKNSPRLELSPDNTKVRKARPGGPSSSETDPYGFLVKGSSIQANSGNKRGSSSATIGDLPTEKRHCGTHFTPYRPAFNYEALAREVDDDDDDGSVDILPVIFDNGKFYQDASFFNSTSESQIKTLPLYDKLEILPIGAQSTESVFRLKEKTCWNCGLPGHETRQCPEPVNKERVDVNRAAFLADRGTEIKGRYYEQLAYYQEVTGHEPGRLSSTLRDALGLDGDYDEPPYYRAMRMYGYPPGYMGTYADQEYVMKVVCGDQLNGDAPDLKIFGLHDDDDDQDHDKKDQTSKNSEGQQHTIKGTEERVYMVTYPGLYPSQMAANDGNPPSSSKQQQGNYQQNQQHTQQHYYNQQHTDGSQHPYHSQSYYNKPQHYNQQYYQGSYDRNGQWIPYYPSAEPHHNNVINQPAYQQYYQGSYDHNGQWTPYYPSAEPHHNNLHNQPTSIPPLSTTLHNPSPPPPMDLDDNMPPPSPPLPPPADSDDDIPSPPPPPSSPPGKQ